MTPFSFDTLSASKQLREAGMPEGMAEAVVSVFQHAYEPVDLSHLATKADIADMATKDDLETLRLAAKADIDALRIAARSDILELEVCLMERMRQQGWATLGGIAVLLAISTAIGKLIA